MNRYLTFGEVVALHAQIVARTGGEASLKDRGLVESAVAQPGMMFGGQDLYPTIVEKAAALGFSLIKNHGFTDGNKRSGHAALETYLVLNGYELSAETDEAESVILQVAASAIDRDELTEWVRSRIVPRRT